MFYGVNSSHTELSNSNNIVSESSLVELIKVILNKGTLFCGPHLYIIQSNLKIAIIRICFHACTLKPLRKVENLEADHNTVKFMYFLDELVST